MAKSFLYPTPPMFSASISRRSTRTQNEWNVAISGLRSMRPPRRCSTRSTISADALLVNVTARIASGSTPRFSIRWAMRKVITLVLPLPAPARINTGPSTASAASRCRGLSWSSRFTAFRFVTAWGSLLLGGVHRHPAAGFTSAVFPQVVPGIDPAGMSVIPADIQCISANRSHFIWPHRLLIHRQDRGHLLHRLSRLPIVTVPFFCAGGAGAGIAQPLKAVMGAVVVLPHNIYPGAGGFVHFYGFWSRYSHKFQYRTPLPLGSVPGEHWIAAAGKLLLEEEQWA